MDISYRLTDKGRMYLVIRYCNGKQYDEAVRTSASMVCPVRQTMAVLYILQHSEGKDVIASFENLDNFEQAAEEIKTEIILSKIYPNNFNVTANLQ